MVAFDFVISLLFVFVIVFAFIIVAFIIISNSFRFLSEVWVEILCLGEVALSLFAISKSLIEFCILGVNFNEVIVFLDKEDISVSFIRHSDESTTNRPVRQFVVSTDSRSDEYLRRTPEDTKASKVNGQFGSEL